MWHAKLVPHLPVSVWDVMLKVIATEKFEDRTNGVRSV